MYTLVNRPSEIEVANTSAHFYRCTVRDSELLTLGIICMMYTMMAPNVHEIIVFIKRE